MIIALIGPSGTGKGTQAERLAARHGFIHFSTGDLLRTELELGTVDAQRIRKFVEISEVVQEEAEIVLELLEKKLRSIPPDQNILLDGVPRTIDQAIALEEVLTEIGRSLDGVIYLDTPDEEIINERIPGRLTCRKCQRPHHVKAMPPRVAGICDRCGGSLLRRPDDVPARVEARLRDFHRLVIPILDRYDAAGKLVIAGGVGTIDYVCDDVSGLVDSFLNGTPPLATHEDSGRLRAMRRGPRVLPVEQKTSELDIILLGAPGSGKGTQAERLREAFEIPHVATGDLFRDNIKNNTELGILAKSFIDRGDLVPDDVTEEMVRDRLSRDDTASGFILDGFPRTVAQADALTDILTDLRRRVRVVIYLDVDDAEIVGRLAGRWICGSCQTSFHDQFRPPKTPGVCDLCGAKLSQRDDDRPETVLERLKTYRRKTAPLVDSYRAQGLLAEVPGTGDIDDIWASVQAAAERARGDRS